MGLEAANFIPELVITNPAGADPVSQGDDHLRLVKNAILGSFPAFVGNTGTPKSITLTEDELNDAVQQAAAASISGLHDYTTNPTILGDAVQTKPGSQADDLLVLAEVQRPPARSFGGASTLLQADEGLIVTYTGSGGDAFNLPVLLIDTICTIKNKGSGLLTIAQSGTALQWLDGAGGASGNRTLAPESVCEVSYSATNVIDIWGNGLA